MVLSHTLIISPDRKMRAASLYFAQQIPQAHNIRVLFVSSMLNLCEFLSLRPDLRGAKTILYFHENQLNYPKRKTEEDRDFQFGWAEATSCLCANYVVFNSEYNRSTFLHELPVALNKVPTFGFEVEKVLSEIRDKSRVMYFPIRVPEAHLKSGNIAEISSAPVVNIVWNHRWEHDKDPGTFLDIMVKLAKKGNNFRVFLLGESFGEQPEVFDKAKAELEKAGVVGHWGYCASKEEYYEILNKCHVAVSTALHEFYGVAVLEAIMCGCYPLCPNRLVYPEYLARENLYNTPSELYKRLKNIIFFQRKESAGLTFKPKVRSATLTIGDRSIWPRRCGRT